MLRGRLPSDLLLIGPLGFGMAPERSGRSNVGHSLAQLVFFCGPLAPRPELGHVDTELPPGAGGPQ